jgi:cation:H+ antiporter
MTIGTVMAFVAGLAGLVGGAELMVRGAARLAARLGISAVVIGLTVVAFGTSAPELAVSVQAALDGAGDLALGNVVGSNVANVLLILGAAAVAGGGLVVAQRIVRLDVPLMIGASVLVLALSLDGRLSSWEGALLLVLIVAYTVWTVRSSRREAAGITTEYDEAFDPDALRRSPVGVDAALVVTGLILLTVGGSLLVQAASDTATALGASDLVIGLTVVAIGTSLPELATSLLAAMRGQRDLAVGNAVGSNLFNLLTVLGLTAVVADGGLAVSQAARTFDLPVMTAVAVACLPVFFNGYVLLRWEGVVFITYYVAYVAYLVVDATDHASQDLVRDAAVLFVVPLTVLTLVVVVVQGWRGSRALALASEEPPATDPAS